MANEEMLAQLGVPVATNLAFLAKIIVQTLFLLSIGSSSSPSMVRV